MRAKYKAGLHTVCSWLASFQQLAQLPLGDDFFRRIGVLDDEVAGVAGHHHGLERTLCAATDLDHLVGSDEMVFQPLTAVDAGGFGLRDDGHKVTVIDVAEHLGEVPAGPKFVARRIGVADGFKWGDVLAHGKEFAGVVGCRWSVVGGRWSVVELVCFYQTHFRCPRKQNPNFW